MRKITTTALSVALATSLSIWGVSPAIAAGETDTPDCRACHGGAHKPGDENPHGYSTASGETTPSAENSESTTAETRESTKEAKQNDTEKTDSKTTTTKDFESADKSTSQDATQTKSSYTPLDENLTLETIDEAIEEEYTSRINALKTEAEALINELNTANAYIANSDRVKDFYQQIMEETNTLCILMKEYAVRYAELILASDLSDGDKRDALDGIYDYIYEDASDEIYDEIYDTILDDLYDAFYDGVLDDRPDSISYEEWDYITTDEYDQLDYARDVVYFLRNRLSSDVYKFRSNIRTALYNSGTERAQNKIDELKESIEKAKQLSGLINGGSNNAQTNTANAADINNAEESTAAAAPQEERDGLLAYLDKWDAQAAENHKVDPYTKASYEAFSNSSKAARNLIEKSGTTSEDLKKAQDAYDDAWYALETMSSQYQSVSYVNLVNSPESYKGQLITKTGIVGAVAPNKKDSDTGLISISTGEADFDMIFILYPLNILDDNITEGTTITVYGTYYGTLDSGDVLKNSALSGVPIPNIYADSIVVSE